MDAEVAVGHAQPGLQRGEGDRRTRGQRRDDGEAHPFVDDRIELAQRQVRRRGAFVHASILNPVQYRRARPMLARQSRKRVGPNPTAPGSGSETFRM